MDVALSRSDVGIYASKSYILTSNDDSPGSYGAAIGPARSNSLATG